LAPETKLSALKGTVTVYMENVYGGTRSYVYKCGTAKVTKVKSSNKNVATLEKLPAEASPNSVIIRGYKPGKATLSFAVNGKKRTVKVLVKKYTPPVKSLKIGGKEIKGSLKNGTFFVSPTSVSGKVIAVKPQSGWKVKSIYGGYINTKDKFQRYTYAKVKNGTKLTKKMTCCYVTLENTATKGIMIVGIQNTITV
jgi:membrane carboxypeptidase/penicillin-binding protein